MRQFQVFRFFVRRRVERLYFLAHERRRIMKLDRIKSGTGYFECVTFGVGVFYERYKGADTRKAPVSVIYHSIQFRVFNFYLNVRFYSHDKVDAPKNF